MYIHCIVQEYRTRIGTYKCIQVDTRADKYLQVHRRPHCVQIYIRLPSCVHVKVLPRLSAFLSEGEYERCSDKGIDTTKDLGAGKNENCFFCAGR